MKLKPCPFCAFSGTKIVVLPEDGKKRFRDKYMVLCDYREGGCGAASGVYRSPEEVAEMWNMRRRKWKNGERCGADPEDDRAAS